MINSVEEAIFIVQGENMAIIFMRKPKIATHPNPKRFLQWLRTPFKLKPLRGSA